jgi:hypothetical protein
LVVILFTSLVILISYNFMEKLQAKPEDLFKMASIEKAK